MRILQLGKYHWKYPGGIERYLGLVHDNFRRPNYTIDIDYVVLGKEVETNIYRNGHSTIYILRTLGKLRSAPILYPSTVIREISRQKYDIIELHHPNPCMHFAYNLIRKKNPLAKLVIYWHSDISRQKLLKKIYLPFQKRLLQDASRIFVASQNYMNSSDDLKHMLHKCEVLPYGHEKLVDKPVVSASKEILSVGRLVYYKGFEYLIKAFAHPSMKNYKLTLIGEGPERKKLENIINQFNLGNNVTITGYVPECRLSDYYKNCALFVLPSVDRAEAFGLVLLEAMAYGKPVVTTSIGTATDFIVKDGFNGRVVKPCSPDELRFAISEIIENKEIMRRMGEASLERMSTIFSVNDHFRKKHDIYKSLMAS